MESLAEPVTVRVSPPDGDGDSHRVRRPGGIVRLLFGVVELAEELVADVLPLQAQLLQLLVHEAVHLLRAAEEHGVGALRSVLFDELRGDEAVLVAVLQRGQYHLPGVPHPVLLRLRGGLREYDHRLCGGRLLVRDARPVHRADRVDPEEGIGSRGLSKNGDGFGGKKGVPQVPFMHAGLCK